MVIFKNRDTEIIDYAIQVKDTTGYPKIISAAWAKNSNDDILNIAKKLNDNNLLRSFTMAIQSMTSEVLEAIQRDNMKINDINSIILSSVNFFFFNKLIKS